MEWLAELHPTAPTPPRGGRGPAPWAVRPCRQGRGRRGGPRSRRRDGRLLARDEHLPRFARGHRGRHEQGRPVRGGRHRTDHGPRRPYRRRHGEGGGGGGGGGGGSAPEGVTAVHYGTFPILTGTPAELQAATPATVVPLEPGETWEA